MHVHTGRRLLLALAVCCVAGLAGTTATASALADLSCTFSGTIDLDPALNGGTVAAPTTGELSGCSSLNGSQPGITSAAIAAPLTASGCFPVPLVVSGPGTFTWNDGSTSTIDARLSTNLFVPPILSVTVTGGRMAGDSILVLPLLVPHGLGCGLGGTDSLDVSGAALFLP